MLRLSLFVISAAAILLAAPALAQQRPIAGGTLQCGAFEPVAQPGFPILGGLAPLAANAPMSLKCLFVPSRAGEPQQIYAVRPQFARGPAVVEPVRLEWNVVAGIPAAPTFLSGGYSGGLDAPFLLSNLGNNLLVGGNENLIVLQPRLIQVSPGQPAGAPNLAANITVLELEFIGCRPESDVC